MRKVLIVVLITLLLLLTGILNVRAQNCWNAIARKMVAPGVIHELVDRNCDMVPDIVQEYRFVNGMWIKTRWWYY